MRLRLRLRQMVTRSASASANSRVAYANGKHMALDDLEEGIMLSTRRYTSGSTSASTALAGHLPRSRQRSAKRSFTNYWRIIGFQRTQCNSSTAIHAKGSWLIGLWGALAPRRNATTTMQGEINVKNAGNC